jgi:hypothetical protein
MGGFNQFGWNRGGFNQGPTVVTTNSNLTVFQLVRTLVDEPTGGTFWTDQQVYDAMNEAQIFLFGEIKFATTTATLTLTQGADITPIPSSLMIPQYYLGTNPSNVVNGVSLGYNRYFFTTHAQLEEWLRDWKEQFPAFPKHLVLWDVGHVRPFPSPDATYRFLMVGIGWPCEFSPSFQDVPAAARLYKRALAYYSAAILLENTLPELADTLNKMALESINELRVRLRNQQSHNIRRMRPGDTFTGAQGGNVRTGLRFR